ncbi:MAG: tRNA epoxyqueuosine(34) reductase QueG [Phycisphaeraceae bacterium]|nr:tRNA epoxyqueuosine(34) reductase QueG [Phycisphaeraceae bacterium]
MIRESDIQAACRALGFALTGVCDLRSSAHADEFHAWLRAGKHGTMEYLARNTEMRDDPALLLSGARSAILVADLYHTRREKGPEQATPASPTAGMIARYARGRDYHKVMKKRLHELCDSLRARQETAEFRAFVDTAPLMEREIANLAGLGWIGKHTLLIHPRIGSYFFLGGILTTLEIDSAPAPLTDHCGTCTRCIDACPTQAITPYSVDASRCISYLTIENRKVIDERFHDAIGNWLYGCDICQEVCPHNSSRPSEVGVGERNPEYAPRRDFFDVLEVLAWTSEDRANAVAGSAMTRATLEMFKRNAVIVAANSIRSGCPEPHRSAILARLTELASDRSESPQLAALAAAKLGSLPLK